MLSLGVRLIDAQVVERGALTDADRAAARQAYQKVLAGAPVDKNKSLVPTRRWQRASATVGLARLALRDDRAESLRLARAAAALIGAAPTVLREQAILAEARLAEGRALQAEGHTGPARAAIEAALALLVVGQVPTSPRLAEAQAALASLPR